MTQWFQLKTIAPCRHASKPRRLWRVKDVTFLMSGTRDKALPQPRNTQQDKMNTRHNVGAPTLQVRHFPCILSRSEACTYPIGKDAGSAKVSTISKPDTSRTRGSGRSTDLARNATPPSRTIVAVLKQYRATSRHMRERCTSTGMTEVPGEVCEGEAGPETSDTDDSTRIWTSPHTATLTCNGSSPCPSQTAWRGRGGT